MNETEEFCGLLGTTNLYGGVSSFSKEHPGCAHFHFMRIKIIKSYDIIR